MTKFQLALDDITLDDAILLLRSVQPYIHIAEIGTPFLMEYGTAAIRRIRQEFPRLEVLCDGKIMDAGAYEAELGLLAGADYTTVLAAAEDATIRDVIRTAEKYHRKAVADMICVTKLSDRVPQLRDLGIHMIAVHTGVDQQKAGRTPLEDLKEIKACCADLPVSVAGGISAQTLPEYLALDPEVIICGGAVLHAGKPVEEAKAIAELLQVHNRREK